MSKWGKANFKGLDKYGEQLKTIDWDTFYKETAKEIAARLLALATQRTPVGQYSSSTGKVGGTLRRGWTIDHEIKRVGNAYEITVINPVEYASYVEFGHRTRGGKGWVKGRFMLTESEIELRLKAPKLLEKRILKLLESLNG